MAKPELIFVTTNENKLREASEILQRQLTGCALELDELQTTDLEVLVRHKAQQAYHAQQSPLFVEDTSLIFRAWNELPGPFIKYFLQNLGVRGITQALESFPDKSAEAVCGVGYHDGSRIHYFEGRVPGTIGPPSGTRGFGWDSIFTPEGFTETFAEMDTSRKHSVSMRARALKQLAAHLEPRAS